MSIATTADELWAAVETFDAEAAEVAIARLLWDVPLSGAVTRVVLPFLQGAPFVLLACPPGERHDGVLLCVALMLRDRGVRARFLGADTPVPAILTAARGSRADEQTRAEIGALPLPADPVSAVVVLVGALTTLTSRW